MQKKIHPSELFWVPRALKVLVYGELGRLQLLEQLRDLYIMGSRVLNI